MKFKAVLVEEPFQPPKLTVMADYRVDDFVKLHKKLNHLAELTVLELEPHWSVRISHSITQAEADDRGGRW